MIRRPPGRAAAPNTYRGVGRQTVTSPTTMAFPPSPRHSSVPHAGLSKSGITLTRVPVMAWLGVRAAVAMRHRHRVIRWFGSRRRSRRGLIQASGSGFVTQGCHLRIKVLLVRHPLNVLVPCRPS